MAEYHAGVGLAGVYAGTLKANGKEWEIKNLATNEVLCCAADRGEERMTIEKARTAGSLAKKYDDIKESLREAEKVHEGVSNGISGIDIRFDGDVLCSIHPKIAVEALDLIIRRLREKRDEIQREIEEL